MVGFFSTFSVNKGGHRRTQSAIAEREVLPPHAEDASTANVATSTVHGFEMPVEFKPVEHPTEPLDSDQPILCPLPEPSILNDGRIWKERVSASAAGARSTADLPPKGGTTGDAEPTGVKPPRPSPPKRSILPSLSAPEHNLLNLLEECNASGS